MSETTALLLPTLGAGGCADQVGAPLAGGGEGITETRLPLARHGGEGREALSPPSARTGELPAAGPGDVPADRLGAWVFGRGAAARMRKVRFLQRAGYETGGRKWAPGDALLDCGPHKGRTIADVLQADGPALVPAVVRAGAEGERRRWGAEEQIRQWLRDFRGQHPSLGRSITAPFAAEFARLYGPVLEKLRAETGYKLRLGKAGLRRIEEGNATGWGNSGRRREELFDADLFDEAVALHLHPNQVNKTGGVSIYAYCQAKAAQEGRLWRGGRTAFAERLKEAVPAPFRKLGQRGAWEFERDCVPKLRRPRERFACGEAASLDGRDSDQLVRVPTTAGGWRAIRPTEVIFFDVSSGYPLGWHIAADETADATLLALRHMHERVGLPRYIETDNGKGFGSAFGSRRRAFPADDVRRLHALCAYLRIEVDHKVPRHAWKKSAESRFSRIKGIDRLSPHFIGGSPGERPEDVFRRVKLDIMALPTLEEYGRQREPDYELYAETPSPALDGVTPRQYFEAHRGTVRKVDPEFLEFASSRLAGERTVGRDGVRYRGILYGHGDEEVFKLQGRRVWLRLDPADLSRLWLCDQAGAPLCIAGRSDLAGAPPEHLREAEKRLAHLRKISREFNAQHDFFRGSAIAQVRQVLSEHRRAQATEYARTHAPVAAPVELVASEHVPAVRKIKAAARREEIRRGLQGGSEAASDPVQTGLDLLVATARQAREEGEEVECQADRLRRFGHAG
jgi:hypothetical protein